MGASTYRQLYDRTSPEKTPNELTYDEIKETVKEFAEPQVNPWSARIAFRQMKQNPGESLHAFENRIRAAATDCTWAREEVQLSLIEQFIAGLCDKNAKKALLLKCKDKKLLSEVFACANEFVLAQKATATAHATEAEVNVLRYQPRSKFTSKSRFQKKPSSGGPTCYRCGKI